MLQKPQYLVLMAALVAAACTDSADVAPSRALEPTASADFARIAQTPEKYVALGTSITMGWSSNGVYAGSQVLSWPELLSFAGAHPISLPLIQSPGCTSPLVAPLGANKRISGEGFAGSAVCAPNVAGVTLPTQNVGLATAIAADAVQRTPAIAGPTLPFYSRVLAPGMTQLTAALSQQPTIVSVEFGGNEVLGATSGLYAPGVTVVPLPYFILPYDAMLDAISASHIKAVLVGLPLDARSIPAMRRGDEIWANRAEFAALHVDVSSDCQGSQNWINVSIKSVATVLTAAALNAAGQPNPVYSCADIPGAQDLVLTPSDIDVINAQLAQMSAHIKEQAAARGFAYFSLGAIFDRSDVKGGAYSVVAQMTSKFPYGLFTSLDGVHPGVFGNVLLAAAAARAINDTYGNLGYNSMARVTVNEPEISLSDRLNEPMLPSAALEQARTIAVRNQGVQISTCWMPGGCNVERAGKNR